MAVRELFPTIGWPTVERRYLVGGILAALTAVLILIATQPAPQSPILVAGSDLPAGAPLADLDVDVRYVGTADGLIEGSSVGDLAGWSLRIPVSAGEPLTVSNLQAPQVLENPNLLALSLPEEQAVLGHLVAGDHVDVYLTRSTEPGEEPVTSRIAAAVYVVEAIPPADGSISQVVKLLLAVDDDLAGVLASANHLGDIDLVRVEP